jgi:hypothetical protein
MAQIYMNKPLTKGAKASLGVAEKIEQAKRDANAWQCYNPSRDVFIDVVWRGHEYVVRSFYVDNNTGGRCTIYVYYAKR